MNNDIFRKKSIDKMNSPEDLNDYVRIANPGVWLMLIAIIILLAGLCVWGIFGRIESKVPVSLSVESGMAECSVSINSAAKIREGMTVSVNDTRGTVHSVDSYAGKVIIEIALPNGQYNGEIITDSIAPISFVFN